MLQQKATRAVGLARPTAGMTTMIHLHILGKAKAGKLDHPSEKQVSSTIPLGWLVVSTGLQITV